MKRFWKKAAGLLLALCVLLSCSALSVPAGARPLAKTELGDFADIPKEPWYRNYLEAAVRLGLFQGTSASTFAPDRPITWAEAVTVLGRLAEISSATSQERIPEAEKPPFPNVPLGRYYTKYAAWAKEKGFLDDITKGEFQPDDPVTQQELAGLFANFLKGWDRYEPLEDVDLTGVVSWLREPVRSISGYRIFPKERWDPQRAAQRSQCAAFFVRLYESITLLSDVMDPDRKYSYQVPGGSGSFHILSQSSEDLYYELIEDQAAYEELLGRVSQSAELVFRNDTASPPERVFQNGWKYAAIELQAAGSPQFTSILSHCFYMDGSGSVIFRCEDLGGGDPQDLTGFVFLIQVPGDTLDLCVTRQYPTEDYNGVPLPSDYPAFGYVSIGDASRWDDPLFDPTLSQPEESPPVQPEPDLSDEAQTETVQP